MGLIGKKTRDMEWTSLVDCPYMSGSKLPTPNLADDEGTSIALDVSYVVLDVDVIILKLMRIGIKISWREHKAVAPVLPSQPSTYCMMNIIVCFRILFYIYGVGHMQS